MLVITKNIGDNLDVWNSHELQQSFALVIVKRRHFNESFLKLLYILGFL